MPIIKLHDSEAATAFLNARNCPGEYVDAFISCAYGFMVERYGYDFAPFVDGQLRLTEDQTARLLSFVAVANAMAKRDAYNKTNKRWDEYQAIVPGVLTWARGEMPIQREWTGYRPLELAYENPEAVDLLREHIITHGYVDHELLTEVMDTPMAMAQGVL